MKSKILGLLAVGLLAPAAHATTYDFSMNLYQCKQNFTTVDCPSTVTTPVTISGSFDGTLNGNKVVNLSNVVVKWNGTELMSGSGVKLYSWDQQNLKWVLGSAVAGFDVFDNNFLFTESDLASIGGSPFFDSAPSLCASYTAHYSGANTYTGAAGEPGPTPSVPTYNADSCSNNATTNQPYRWTLTESNGDPSVPEPGTLALLGLGLAGLGLSRRRMTAN